MKKSSKNNSFGKNNKREKKITNSDFIYQNTNSSKKNNNFRINSNKNNPDIFLNESDSKSKFSSFKRRNLIDKSNIKISSKAHNLNNNHPNKRNYDDWIWGKHSVFEALNNERAINRIWCTSEIFSSEKFYILLKDLKSKGVLIEEVSWSRLSQLTFGASHQGVALQLACSKTISLQELIHSSKKNSANPIILALDGITDPHNVGQLLDLLRHLIVRVLLFLKEDLLA